MNFAAADQIVKAVLYEGYVLYPYRPSAIKNQQRWTFGGVFPAGCPSEGASGIQTQCLVEGDGEARCAIRVRFLQPVARQVWALPEPAKRLDLEAQARMQAVASLRCDGRDHLSWEEAVEREVVVTPASLFDLAGGQAPQPFAYPASRTLEPIVAIDGTVRGAVVRAEAAIEGTAAITAQEVAGGAWRLSIRVDNTTRIPSADTADRKAARRRSFMSTHVILGVEGGAFVSLIDPPAQLAVAARSCINQSAWPVLVGPEGARDTLLCSPIILYDHPQVAAESPGDLYDGTEIDEILTLRILTMTDAEKAEMAAGDERARALLARTEALTPAQMAQLHGTMRDPRAGAGIMDGASKTAPRLAVLNEGALSLRVGDQVRLRPKGGGDIFDIALAGQSAIIEAIELDFDNRVHVAVTVDGDPGQDFGMARMPGHRFFFSPEEIEPIGAGELGA